MQADKSLEAVVWVAVGGRGTLLGPIVGAVGVNALKSWAVRAFPDLWYIILGGLFILVVLFLPGGLVSIPKRLAPFWKRIRKTGTSEEAAPTEPPDLKPEAASHKS
jgi:urea transport system permease protein